MTDIQALEQNNHQKDQKYMLQMVPHEDKTEDRMWISGRDTYKLREELKGLGGTWDKDRKAWLIPSSLVNDVMVLHEKQKEARKQKRNAQLAAARKIRLEKLRQAKIDATPEQQALRKINFDAYNAALQNDRYRLLFSGAHDATCFRCARYLFSVPHTESIHSCPFCNKCLCD